MTDAEIQPATPGPADQPDLLEMLFARMPMGIAIFDRGYRIVRYNPTWADYAERYAPPSAPPLQPGIYYFDHFPGAEEVSIPMFEQVLAGETIRMDGARFQSGAIISYWDVLLAPLVQDGAVTGILNVTSDATERVLLQQTLELRVEERTRELDRRREIAESLRDIIGMINANLPLDDFLERAVELAAQRLGAAACVLHRFDLEEHVITHLASHGMEGIYAKGQHRPFQEADAAGAQAYLEATLRRQPTFANYPPLPERVDQIRREESIPKALKAQRIALRRRFAGALSVPLFIQDQVFGGIVFYFAEPQPFDDEQLQLGMTFAEQVAIGLENARLLEQVEGAAIAAERNRLARDLHDAVTQTLFSASIIAEVLPRLWQRDHDEGLRRLQELRQLTRGALSEMRTLLLELRPSTLVDTPLVDLIGHQVTAFVARTRLQVDFSHQCRNDPPIQVKEMFYRIVQEALNNIAKHANASAASIQLDSRLDQAGLTIKDDGAGFDPQWVHAEGLGLNIMRERAQAIGARFELDSEIGKGTQLRVLWEELPDKEKKND